jgi:hypothetical protein
VSGIGEFEMECMGGVVTDVYDDSGKTEKNKKQEIQLCAWIVDNICLKLLLHNYN